jgi:hypothetical protein
MGRWVNGGSEKLLDKKFVLFFPKVLERSEVGQDVWHIRRRWEMHKSFCLEALKVVGDKGDLSIDGRIVLESLI